MKVYLNIEGVEVPFEVEYHEETQPLVLTACPSGSQQHIDNTEILLSHNGVDCSFLLENLTVLSSIRQQLESLYQGDV